MTDPLPHSDDATPEPGNLRLLRLLVTTLTAVMIVGLVVVVGLLVTRLSNKTPPLPETITLPGGAQALAVTMGPGWYAVVTDDQRILIFDATSGKLRQTVGIE
ncbi:DUF6476 family protein [Antarcticimicrobium luteum]|uniref:Uncharacterized protein n=1 Tax=Antarcticimicrobium luteum TaxID=2547397 RepID=A0A4R5VFZ0_9RHOB|nr:DUF6476 family protein [Antarcticimicrobium luteum]TDK51747.1 hypothetical protein E1832_02835 [Antarcticimicrobium luteum]